MSELLDNAVISIELGVLDIGMGDQRRVLSATRNIYAGILLLCKHILWNASPEGTDGLLIYSNFVPKKDGNNIVMVPAKGSRTIDRARIKERFQALGLGLDWSHIDALAQIRNDIEHSFTKEPERIEGVLGSALSAVEQLIFEHVKKAPVDVFSSKAWTQMLKNDGVFDIQKARCKESFENVNWPNDINPLYIHGLLCSYCGSSLVQQVDSMNTEYNAMKLRCMQCGKRLRADSLFSSEANSIMVN